MLKRLLIVLLCAAGIVFVPSLIGRIVPFSYMDFDNYWLTGFMCIVCTFFIIIIGYTIFFLIIPGIYDYIIGKK